MLYITFLLTLVIIPEPEKITKNKNSSGSCEIINCHGSAAQQQKQIQFCFYRMDQHNTTTQTEKENNIKIQQCFIIAWQWISNNNRAGKSKARLFL